MSKSSIFLAARLVLASLPTALLGAQAPAKIVRDLKGVVQGAAEDARVLVTLWHNDMKRGTVDPLVEGVAKPDGSFAFEGVTWFEKQQWGFNTVLLVARSGDRIGIVQLRSDKVKIDALRVDVRESIEIRGVLRDEETNKPIENAWVWPSSFGRRASTARVWLTSPLLPWHARTDAKGRFVLEGLPDMEPIQLMAGGPDHARTWVQVDDRNKVEALLKRVWIRY